MRSLIYLGVIILLIAAIISCRTNTKKSNSGAVKHMGRLDAAMAGNFQNKIRLDSVYQLQNFYALGAMDSLAGEIQVFNSQPFNSVLEDDSVLIKNNLNDQAAFLVYGEVGNWRELNIPTSVSNTEALIGYLEYDEALKIESNEPFFFLIEGVVEELDWHVIKKSADTASNANDHAKNAVSGTLKEVDVEIFGVYSKEHGGVFTHYDLPIHMHFKTLDGSLAGHVDDLELGSEMNLKLPIK